MANKIRQSVILGALLHDIGKFWQRADKFINSDKAEFLSDNTKKIRNDFCKPNEFGRFSNLHSAWTFEFIHKFEDYLFSPGGKIEEHLLNLAAQHHKPQTTLQEIIQIADWTSSGMDRRESKDIKDELSDNFNFRKQRLRPVFESIFSDDNPNLKTINGNVRRYQLTPLSLKKNALFTGEFEQIKKYDLRDEYLELWNGFTDELKKIPNNTFDTFIESFLPLLQKYTWCIPSSTNDNPDISLFDHLKTTAALAVCLYDYFNENNPNTVSPDNRELGKISGFFNKSDVEYCQLICGDISGIQKLIYSIQTKGASTSLKGRSFGVQLISDTASRMFLNELDLPLTNLIYSSGGNFYILAPNVSNLKNKINRIQDKINKYLFTEYDGQLFIGIGSVCMSANDFKFYMSEKWADAIKNANESKRQKFKNIMVDYEVFFEPFGFDGKSKPCKSCGNDCKSEKDEVVCSVCEKFIKLGSELRTAKYLIEFSCEGKFKNAYRPLGGEIGYFLTDEENLRNQIKILSNANFIKVHKLNSPNDYLNNQEQTLKKIAYSFKIYGGNQLPLFDNGNIKTFNELTGTGEFKRLGVLRMDLDNLGLIFQKGLLCKSINNLNIPKAEIENTKQGLPYSISRLSTLSNQLDLFFSGYLNTLRNKDNFKDHIIINYAGGDDLFVVGRWDKVIEFGKLINDEFKEFTGGNPNLTISGGMSLITQKHPISRGASYAGEAESQAKSIRKINGVEKSKDAIHFLGKTLSWNDFEFAEHFKDLLIKITEEKNSNHGLLIQLRKIYETYLLEKERLLKQNILNEKQRRELINYNKWRWVMVYALTRLSDRDKRNLTQIKNIQEALADGNNLTTSKKQNCVSEVDMISFLDIPVRWTEFLIRTNKIKE